MGSIDLKTLKPNDALLLSEVAWTAYADHYLHLWYDQGKWYQEKYFSVERLETELKDRNSIFYLAYYLNAPLGSPLEGEEERRCMELERIYLSKAATGKGIGKKLVNLTFTLAKI